jgi:hypothetical protein
VGSPLNTLENPYKNSQGEDESPSFSAIQHKYQKSLDSCSISIDSRISKTSATQKRPDQINNDACKEFL